MELAIIDEKGVAAGRNVGVSDTTFGADYNEALIHQVVVAYMAAARSGTKAQKTRSEVRGGGRNHPQPNLAQWWCDVCGKAA